MEGMTMRCNLVFAVILFFAFAPFCVASPGLRNIGPGGGGMVSVVQPSRWDRNMIFAGSDVGGFYVSENAGRSWRVSNGGIVDRYVTAMAESPLVRGEMLLGVRGGIYFSADFGKNWSLVTNGLPTRGRYSYSITVSGFSFSGDGRRVFAGIGFMRDRKSGRGSVYASDDGGRSWANIVPAGALPEDLVVGDIAVHPADSRRILVSTPDRGIFLTTDGGRSWRTSNTGLPSSLQTRHLAQCRGCPSRIYVTIRQTGGEPKWNAGVYRSDDAGETWRPVNEGLKKAAGRKGNSDMMSTWCDEIAVHPSNPDVAYAAGATWWDTGVYRTVDGGGRWTKVVDRPEDGWLRHWGMAVRSMGISETFPDMLAFGTPGVLFVSEDGGESWSARYSGLENTCLHKIVPHPLRRGTFYLCFYDIGLFVTEDYGRTCRRIVGNLPSAYDNSCFDLAVGEGRRLVGKFGWWSNGKWACFESFDGGETWALAQDASVPECMKGSSKGPMPPEAGSIRNVFREGDLVLATARDSKARSNGGAYLSKDGGKNWKRIYRYHFCEAAYIDRGRIYISFFDHQYHDNAGGGGVLVSEDRGKSWRKLVDLPNECVNCIVRDPFSETLWIGTAGNGVFVLEPEEHQKECKR